MGISMADYSSAVFGRQLGEVAGHPSTSHRRHGFTRSPATWQLPKTRISKRVGHSNRLLLVDGWERRRLGIPTRCSLVRNQRRCWTGLVLASLLVEVRLVGRQRD